MGRLDPAVLSVCCSRSFKEALVFVRLSAGRGRNVQGTIAAGCDFFCSLAIVAKKVDASFAITRGVCVDDGPASFAVAFAHSNGVDCGRAYWRRQFFDLFRRQISARLGVGGRYDRSGNLRGRSARRRQLCMAANWFSLRQRALSISLHQLVLQLAVLSRPSRLVVKRFALVVCILVATCRCGGAV